MLTGRRAFDGEDVKEVLGHWQVSTAGGTRPLWARSGQDLIYVSLTGALMRVGVERASSWAATTPTLVVKEGYFTIPNASSRILAARTTSHPTASGS